MIVLSTIEGHVESLGVIHTKNLNERTIPCKGQGPLIARRTLPFFLADFQTSNLVLKVGLSFKEHQPDATAPRHVMLQFHYDLKVHFDSMVRPLTDH